MKCCDHDHCSFGYDHDDGGLIEWCDHDTIRSWKGGASRKDFSGEYQKYRQDDDLNDELKMSGSMILFRYL